MTGIANVQSTGYLTVGDPPVFQPNNCFPVQQWQPVVDYWPPQPHVSHVPSWSYSYPTNEQIQSYTVKYKRLDESAIPPKRNNSEDAGLDLFALEDVVIPSIPRMLWRYIKHLVFGESFFAIKDKAESEEIHDDNIVATKVKTGIAFEIPSKQYGQILDRSGMASKMIKTVGGVVDSTYRGDVTVMLINLSFKDYQVKKGDKIAQMVLLPVNLAVPLETSTLTETDRGDKGFGSSGR